MKLATVALVIIIIAGCNQSSSYKIAPWQAGQWVEYIVSPRSEATSPEGAAHIRYSIVGDHTADGVKYFWFETYGKMDTSNFIFKLMVPERFAGQARRVIIKIGTAPATEMPAELSDAPDEYQPPLYNETEILKKKVKTEKVKTPAGVFRCIHSRMGDADVWLSSQIPIIGIVKYTSPNQEMTLTGFGPSGAQTRITELPQRLDLNKIFPKQDSSGK